ncbi:hypothetical protein FHX49_001896 [Microbacterium endophyticum]|uniref:Large extracellular alpha-helical protein n=1 Tax=Microbacterium endophyticum TaxID=1526412 RepID=A0A7W4V3Q3_9MICO|nr:DUF5719 family protein [Microbacterium endophyticum]MBB2976322.1 hypothetical protein [Microbacterium endophyticum]NIK35202.1 hypothetical protein [Microbacterium endophyticum]
MSNRRIRRWALTSARVLVGAAIAAATVLGVVVAVAAPWPSYSATPVAVDAEPALSNSVLACTGPLLASARDSTQASLLSVAGDQKLTTGAAPGASVVEADSLNAASVADGATVSRLTAQPRDGAASDIAGAGSASVEADDLRGFAASSCQPALMDSWLVAGSATTGAADLIVLSNPGVVPATVQLTIYGATGAITPDGGTDVVIPAGSQRVLPLAGLALNEPTPVIRVTASGAPVAASLQSSVTRTLVPGGVDQVGAIQLASQTQVIPGVTISKAARSGTVTTVLRVLSAGTDATASVVVADEDGAVLTEEVPLTADMPVEVDLSELKAGDYTVSVNADAAVVAAVWHATGLGEGSDIAWFSSAPEVNLSSTFAVASGPSPTLTLANSSDADTTVALEAVGSRGKDLEIDVPAGGTVTTNVVAEAVYVMTPDAPVHAAITFSGDGQLSGYPVWPADAAASTVTVYP